MSWVVLVEETSGWGRERMVWSMIQAVRACEDREAAREAALALTRTHRPEHPWSERAREVFRVSPDEYLVQVEGATRGFHFRVTVAERL